MTALRLEKISKSFGEFIANDNINLTVEPGSIHAILGENGAGKTTLMKIISGVHQPDTGQIYLDNKLTEITSPNIAIHNGIGMIHQHFMLIPELSVTENIILGTSNNIHLNLKQKAAEINQIASYGLEVPLTAKVKDLPVGTQQRVEILKALYRQARTLILDEPTAVLTPSEVKSLFQVLRQLAENNHTILFISHKLNEVMEICDTITVLRRGKVIATTKVKNTTPQELAEMMVGRTVNITPQKTTMNLEKKVILAVENLDVKNDLGISTVRGLSFRLHQGEILGVAGVDGNGQRELADSIAGLREITSGNIRLTPADNQPAKIGYIPEDRQTMGLILSFSLARNLILKAFKFLPFCRYGFLRNKTINHHAENAIQAFDIRTTNAKLPAKFLSGGNQQKIILARELSKNPTLIIAMQPTRGLDIGATESVQECLLAQKEQGAAILYISTELEEVLAMSDRIAVIYNGKFVEILDADDATVERVGYLMSNG
ncbi:MAG: ABC transporter ATP-binding protein [Cyanobacteriota bacterium]|nr:ABC transporter ATP-binding protein [Cyanobacteriota bacterium]